MNAPQHAPASSAPSSAGPSSTSPAVAGAAAPAVERRERRTLMDGLVVMFADAFVEGKGAFGPTYDARGPYEVSASRSAVVVHRAEARDAEAFGRLQEALRLAWEAHERLRRTAGRLF